MSAVRLGLILILAFSVLSFGGVQVWSQSVLEIVAAVLLILWAILAYRSPDAVIYWSPLNWPLLGLIGIGVAQLLFHQSAYAFLTRAELLRLTSYFIFFFLSAQSFRDKTELSRLVWFIVILCFGISLLGIIQHFTSEQDIYWLPSIHVKGDPFGPYVNRNHFAGFVELTLPMGLALIVFRGMRDELLPLAAVLTVVPVSAMILAGSRGGIVTFGIEIVLLALLARNSRVTGSMRVGVLLSLALVALALVAWVGAEKAIQRFSGLQANDVSLARRVSMVRGALHIFLDHPIEGAGLGTLVDVYPHYETIYDGKVVDHAHNDYAELLADTGLLGAVCGAAFVILLYRIGRRNFESRQSRFSWALHAGANVAVIGLLLHSFVDFNLHIPSNAFLFLLQSYLVSSDPLPSESPVVPHRRDERTRPIGQMAGRVPEIA